MGWRLYSGALMPDLLLKAYVLTARLFGWLLAGDYPPISTRWFWKAMVPVFLMHSAVLYGLVQMTLYFSDSGVKLPTRMVWSFLGAAVIFEYLVSLRIIRALGPTEQR
jgi:Zn-dependent protease